MIYLDHNATTPVAPEVFAAIEPYLREEWGNPSSSYRFGSRLKRPLEDAREQVAELLGATPREILFTSGGTESDNTALHSILRADPARRHLITSAVEHSAVLSCCRGLEDLGFRITYLPVDRHGLLSLADLETAITRRRPRPVGGKVGSRGTPRGTRSWREAHDPEPDTR